MSMPCPLCGGDLRSLASASLGQMPVECDVCGERFVACGRIPSAAEIDDAMIYLRDRWGQEVGGGEVGSPSPAQESRATER